MKILLAHSFLFASTDWLEVLMRETGEVEETYMTESIVSEAKEVAMDILREMKSVAVTNRAEEEELQIIFDEQ